MTKTPKTTKAAAQMDVVPKAAAPKAAKAEAPPKGTKVEQPKAGHKPNALQQPLQPSPELAAIVGEGTMPRGEVVSKVWVYIKTHKLQGPDDGRVIVADDKLRQVFGKDQATMFEMNKLLAQHLK
jgi:upstream activation factor subunit UAF30